MIGINVYQSQRNNCECIETIDDDKNKERCAAATDQRSLTTTTMTRPDRSNGACPSSPLQTRTNRTKHVK